MPTLQQMYDTVNRNSYYSRINTEIWGALEMGGFRVYTQVLKEFKGTFIKVDSSTVALVAGQQDYTLPADLAQLYAIAERQSSSENWHEMDPEGVQDAFNNVQQDLIWFDYAQNYGEKSQFRFYGPYLDATNAQNSPGSAQVQKIRISPAPGAARYVQLVYGAKWLPITAANSKVMLPAEGTYAMQCFATAECCRANDDATMAASYEAQGEKHLTEFLSFMRVQNSTQNLRITPYLG